jgi:flagellar protein FlaG
MNTEMHTALRIFTGPDLALPPPPRAPSSAAEEPPTAGAAPSGTGRVLSERQAQAAAAAANRMLAEKGAELALEFDDALDRMIFKLVDTRTREVVRQVPAEAVLAIARALAEETSTGALLKADA